MTVLGFIFTISELLAIGISVIALIVSILSWRSSVHKVKASIFENRYEVFKDAEGFIQNWMEKGKPDTKQLHIVVGAWNRSHFLFGSQPTEYLRQLWEDVVKVDYLYSKMEGEPAGSPERIKIDDEVRTITRKYMSMKSFTASPLLEAFKGEMKVK